MTISSHSIFRWRLAQVSCHLVVALVVLVVIGGATRVMEAGLACPDWPLCFGTFLPYQQMNVQVFLEWFHRLDAFFVGIALIIQMVLAFYRRSELPSWVPWLCGGFLLLVVFQGGLGALTVLNLLPSVIVIAHLACALFLLVGVSALSQRLICSSNRLAPLPWRVLATLSLASVIAQSLIGSRMSTIWAFQRCIDHGQSCEWLDLHRFSALAVTIFILMFIISAIFSDNWSRRQWPFLLSLLVLLVIQITLGLFSVALELSEPLVTVAHQLVAALLVALLAALTFRSPQDLETNFSIKNNPSVLDPSHG